MPARKLDFYLNASDPLRDLTRAARRLSDLHQILAKSVPPELAKSCCVKQLRDGVLFLAAANAAVATQLRQLSARLLAGYQKQGSEVTSIRIEVQVSNPASAPAARREKHGLSTESIEKINGLADTLEDSPLKDALHRLASRGGKTT
ncbi:MAG: DUF721 domain-containing protein [Betaproteobacteria bacterium]|jgi:hypothetical protein|nr:DUF721 domain-containing protein [Betaproteobacteria bacterium]